MMIDADILRIALIALGGIIVLAVYVWERLRHDDDGPGEIGWQESNLDMINPKDAIGITKSPSSHHLVSDSEFDRSLKALSELAGDDKTAYSQNIKELNITTPIQPKVKNRCTCEEENDYWPTGTSKLVLQLNVGAKNEPFDGPKILKALEKAGCRADERGFFHYYAAGEKEAQFSIASLVRPGTIPIQDNENFKTPGLTLFTEILDTSNGIVIFSNMLSSAKILASELAGELQDDTRSVLTSQTIEHIQNQILEYQRQVQLAARRCYQ